MPTLKLSISGIRGIIGDGFDIKEVLNYTSAFISLLPKHGSKVLVARDTRLTGEMIKNVVISTFISSGIDVIDAGIIPTPTALYMTDKLKLNAAIMISASHNPIEWNALKLIGKNGVFLSQEDINKVIKSYNKKETFFQSAKKIGKYKKIDNASHEHINQILRFIDEKKIKRANFTVACDYVNGTGLYATPKLLKKLGVKEISINNEDTGIFSHDAEPSKSSMIHLSKIVKKEKVDIGFMQDPDSDRLAIVLNDGNIVSEEYTLALCAKYLWTKGKGDACVNMSTSMMIDDIGKEGGNKVYRSAIGEINVSNMIRENKLYFGGEGNGGIIIHSVTPGRDSLLAIALILELMAETKKTIKHLVDECPKYYIVKNKVEIEHFDKSYLLKKIKNEFPKGEINTIDGIKVIFDNAWFHIRESNTEPIVRIISEAKTVKEAKNYIEILKNILKHK